MATMAMVTSPDTVEAQLEPRAVVRQAIASSPEVRLAALAVAAAAGRERQAGAFPNPQFTYGREQTSRGPLKNAQGIAQLEQGIELGRPRSSRLRAARAKRLEAENLLAATQARIALDATLALIDATRATQRTAALQRAVSLYATAQRVSNERLRAGDISGYTVRRLRLEVSRHTAEFLAADGSRRDALLKLSSLIGSPLNTAESLILPDSLDVPSRLTDGLSADTIEAIALTTRSEIRAARHAVEAARAEAQTVGRERSPLLTLSAGYKAERVADPILGSLTGFGGLVFGATIPLPILDRRAGAVATADAEARSADEQLAAVQRNIARESAVAKAALRSAISRQQVLESQFGDDARIALNAVQTAYSEGEITLIEWLDAHRAYLEAELILLDLRTDVLRQTARVKHAMGEPLWTDPLPPEGQ